MDSGQMPSGPEAPDLREGARPVRDEITAALAGG